MLSRFQTSSERLDRSLQTLTDSIAAYNPSPTAAEDLLAADDALNEDLECRKEPPSPPLIKTPPEPQPSSCRSLT